MHAKKWLFILINLVGGMAVIGSYVYGFLTRPDAAEVLWGGVPQGMRPLYTVNMILATAGYFAFTTFILLRPDPGEPSIFGRFGAFNILYAIILFPSALWMPLTFLAVDRSSTGILWAVRVLLALVGLASLVILIFLLNTKVRQPKPAYWLAVAGCVFFCIQTALLDAIVWGALFRL